MGVMFNQRGIGTAVVVPLKASEKSGVLITLGSKLPTPCLLTGVQLNQEVNAMVAPTLGNDTYIYSFGDKASSLNLRGMVMPRICKDGEVTGAGSNEGVTSFLSWYDTNKFSSRLLPVYIALGSRAFRAYVLGSTLEPVVSGVNLTISFSIRTIGALSDTRNTAASGSTGSSSSSSTIDKVQELWALKYGS